MDDFNLNKIEIDMIANKDEIVLLDRMECSLDYSIPLEPVMCLDCEAIFCKDCLDNWVSRNNICPMKCTQNFRRHNCKNTTIISSQIKKIKLYCPYKHLGCNENILINDYKKHNEICDFRFVDCNLCSKKRIRKIELLNHLTNECIMNEIKCPNCNVICYPSNILNHIQTCINSKNLCYFCGIVHSDNSLCKNIIENCQKCNLPEIREKIIKNTHICVNNKTMQKVSLYYYSLFKKISRTLEDNVKIKSKNCESHREHLQNIFQTISNSIPKFTNHEQSISNEKNRYKNSLENFQSTTKYYFEELIKLEKEEMNLYEELHKSEGICNSISICSYYNKTSKTHYYESKNSILDNELKLLICSLDYDKVKNLSGILSISNDDDVKIKDNFRLLTCNKIFKY